MYDIVPFKYIRSSSNPLKAYGKEWAELRYPWDLLGVKVNFKGRRSESAETENVRIDETNGPVFIGENVSVKDSEIRGPAWIGKNSSVGPDALIRKGSIGSGCKIGNSVEIKNSIISKNTNVPHLSYVGDSIIGSGVNLAAGTKIANLRHDERNVKVDMGNERLDSGRRKLGAVIGDYVKTGIDTKIYQGSVVGPFSLTSPGSRLDGRLPPMMILKGEKTEKLGKDDLKSCFPSQKNKIDELWGKLCAE